jgi:hypothetical protein
MMMRAFGIWVAAAAAVAAVSTMSRSSIKSLLTAVRIFGSSSTHSILISSSNYPSMTGILAVCVIRSATMISTCILLLYFFRIGGGNIATQANHLPDLADSKNMLRAGSADGKQVKRCDKPTSIKGVLYHYRLFDRKFKWADKEWADKEPFTLYPLS